MLNQTKKLLTKATNENKKKKKGNLWRIRLQKTKKNIINTIKKKKAENNKNNSMQLIDLKEKIKKKDFKWIWEINSVNNIKELHEVNKKNLKKINKYYAEITYKPQIQYKKEKIKKKQVNKKIKKEIIKGYIMKINERGKQISIQLGPKINSNIPIKKTIFKYNTFTKTKQVYNKLEAYFYELIREKNKWLKKKTIENQIKIIKQKERKKEENEKIKEILKNIKKENIEKKENKLLEKWKKTLEINKTWYKIHKIHGVKENQKIRKEQKIKENNEDDYIKKKKEPWNWEIKKTKLEKEIIQQKGEINEIINVWKKKKEIKNIQQWKNANTFQQKTLNKIKKKIQWWWIEKKQIEMKTQINKKIEMEFVKKKQEIIEPQIAKLILNISKLYNIKTKEYFLQELSPQIYIFNIKTYWYYLYNEYFYSIQKTKEIKTTKLTTLEEKSKKITKQEENKIKTTAAVKIKEGILNRSLIAKKYKTKFNKICKWSKNSNQVDKIWAMAIKKKRHWLFTLNTSPLWEEKKKIWSIYTQEKKPETNQILLNHMISNKIYTIYFNIHYNYLMLETGIKIKK